ncbi:hypothetical protein FQ087_18620 [Sporosarcina sp. ANT_H38]|uniref:hypothetical protein n=1 Tax=Sporosarcina sp. ANT_H38 TaxID=2597358 RepID=UPI0011F18AAD|nr:hypothetical protein [Sporosarcina sp. ANT_H38]KAA0944139.1 hypothetical protein FQ087_18620 [Sporosarcina sp. ANT_H38]
MSKKNIQFEVVPERDYTDFSDRMEGKYAMSNKAMIGIGATTAAAITAYGINAAKSIPATVAAPVTTTLPIPELTPIVEPINVLAQTPLVPVSAMATPDLIQTGYIAESSMNMLANVLDPLIQILVAISFPIASVIMVGSCFFFMLGNSEKAWQNIFNAGLGYVLVQMSPLFLKILQEIGKAV